MSFGVTEILWLVALGVAIAVIYSFAVKAVLGKFVSALINIDAVGAENAISPDKLGVKVTYAVKQALKMNGMFAQTVKTDDGGQTYYIEKSMKDKAGLMYREENTKLVFVAGLLLITVCVILAAGYLYGGVITDLFNSVFGA